MKIVHRPNTPQEKQTKKGAARAFAIAPPMSNPVCRDDCLKYKEVPCNRSCPDAPTMLSSDLGKYPLDPKIVPLVFELKRLGYFSPCWSCEGHLSPQGEFWKSPRVWFYASSLSHVRILGNAIENMANNRLLKSKWQIKYIPSDETNLDAMFSLQPDYVGDDTKLEDLQEDINTIAANLFTATKSIARAT